MADVPEGFVEVRHPRTAHLLFLYHPGLRLVQIRAHRAGQVARGGPICIDLKLLEAAAAGGVEQNVG